MASGRVQLGRRLASAAVLIGAVAAATLTNGSGCSSTSPPQRDCFARIWVPASQQDVAIVSSWAGWDKPLIPLPYDQDWKLLRVQIPPGEHGYLLRQAGEDRLDPSNPLTTFRADEREVSLVQVPDCDRPRVIVESIDVSGSTIDVKALMLSASSVEPVDRTQIGATTTDGQTLQVVSVDEENGRLHLRLRNATRGKHTIVINAKDEGGVDAEPDRAVAWVEPAHAEWRDAILYQVMMDRFRGDAGQPLMPPPNPGARAGGTLGGVTDALLSGELEAMGITGLWLSPVYLNPDEPRLGSDGQMYEGYHGYWVLDGRRVEPRLGGEEALDALLDAAHDRGIAVLLDLVPNHIYEENPTAKTHPADEWFYPTGCVCGQPECPWGEFIQTCWFTPYLPDFRFENPDVMDYVLDESSFWTETFDIDGIRMDAVPMMRRAASRRIADRLRRQQFPRDKGAMFLLGEVFTGPGLGALNNLKTHLGPADLDSVFDFPGMWALRGAASGNGSFIDFEAVLAEEEASFGGRHLLLARMIDNHDVARFVSEAAGDPVGAPWETPPPQPLEDDPYDRQELALAINFTLPGIPVVYYGDEVGLAGATDPDNRRVMPAEEELTGRQLALRERVQRLGQVRRCSEALRRGDRIPLLVQPQRYAYLRGSDTSAPVLVAANASSATVPFSFDAGAVPGGIWIDAITGEEVSVTPGQEASIEVEGPGYRILVRPDDPCRP